MAAKIFAGLVAAIALTGVGIYAATGSVPGVETVAEMITPSSSGGCQQSSGCPMSAAASTCPSMVSTCDLEPISAVRPSAALTGGLGFAAEYAVPVASEGCCAK